MSLMFSISEGIKGIFKARLASTISITSITLMMLLIGLFVVFAINLQSWLEYLREKIEIELFVEMGCTDKEIDILIQKVKQTPGVKDIEYISKEEAAERFNREFGQNVLDILEYNPFPPSIIIHLEKGYKNPEKTAAVKNRLELLNNVDEVFYKKPLLDKIDKYINIIYAFGLIVGIIIIVMAVALIYNTIRLTIYARKEMIHIMRLVGATEGFIRKPFLVEGITQGIVGGLISSIIVFYGLKLVQVYVYPYLIYHPLIFAGLIIFGMFIGLFSAYLSVGKYLKII